MMKKFLMGLVIVISLIVLVGGSNAATINIDFQNPTILTKIYNGQGVLGSGTYWNAVGHSGATNLLDDAGNPTGVGVDPSLIQNYANAIPPGDALLADRIIFGPDPGTVLISGLTANSYFDIAAYNGFYSQKYSIAGQGVIPAESTSIQSANLNYDNFGSWVEGTHYVILENALSDGNGQITLNIESSPSFNYGEAITIAGLQISQVPVPAAVWLFGSGLVGLAGFRRSRNA
ncbi:VPLPA-CTERM sorting domain-containing protein [Desulfobacula sp.]|uniref:VPLPA-CTERM sorting domain-containing protein n=1 Tax=Desulfobacula sp. TaxID=2593537 RepID=UPI0039B8E6D5